MSKIVRVVVLCPYGRRETVSLTPNSSILQILEEACRKQKLDPNDYDVCHYNKPLDLTLPVRFASLPNNAQLELKPTRNARQDSLVTIALQLESGQRIMKDFEPSVSVWDVVAKCLDIQCMEDYNTVGEPICIYMRQTLAGEELKHTTLRSLGLTRGSAIIRLSYKKQENISDQDNPLNKTASSPQQDNTINTVPSAAITNISDEVKENDKMECDLLSEQQEMITAFESDVKNSNVLRVAMETQNECQIDEKNEAQKIERSNLKNKEPLPFSGKGVSLRGSQKPSNYVGSDETVSKEPMDQAVALDDVEHSNEIDVGAIHYIGGQHAVLYSLDDITEVKKADLPDEFFELTLDDAKYLMEQYKKARLEIENTPLLTKELRNRQLLKRLGRFKQTVIRIYFPERLVLQAVFDASETVQNVQDFIREYLDDKSLDFYLYTAPPKEKKDPTKSLIESMLIPAAVVYFGCDKHLPFYLLSSFKDKISDPRAAALAAYESRKHAESFDTEDLYEETEVLNDTMAEYKVPGPDSAATFTKPQSSEKIPKWLKLSKK